jgi:DAK2 domain fusion protein YloV
MIDEIGREELVSAVARAALLGARGNSGVILSQIVRGAAEELASRPGELVDPVLVAAAFARASDAAYGSVRDPAEGTMLSAIRAMAHRVAQDLALIPKSRLGTGATPEEQDELIAGVLERALEAAQEAVERGPGQLPVLREAGVVDAGAYGLTIILAGVVAALRGDESLDLAHQSAPTGGAHLPEHVSTTFRYCTNFAVTGSAFDGHSFVPALEAIGDSVLVVGDERTLRVHVHTDEPAAAVEVFEGAGEVSRLDVADMREQVADREARLAGDPAAAGPQACAVVVVASGEGVRRMYEDLGAFVVDGGPTMNPSTYELLAGVHAAGGAEAIVLPNSRNVIMAAERAAELSDKTVSVVSTRSQQAGLAAAVALDATRSAAENAAAMADALAHVRTGAVTEAARDDAEGVPPRFHRGDAVGFVDERIVAWGQPAETLEVVLGELGREAELLTLIEGHGAPLDDGAVTALAPDGVDVEYSRGDQPAYWWLISAE